MTPVAGLEVNVRADRAYEERKYSVVTLAMMLFSRVVLFGAFQYLFFVAFKALGADSPWEESANWWPFTVTFTNVICALAIHALLRREGKSFRGFFAFTKGRIVKDFLIMSGMMLAMLPIAYLPNMLLGRALFGDFMAAVDLFYRPLPLWAAFAALLLFPITMPLGELTTYFGYVMPRLEVITGNKWAALAIPAVMLSLQHVTVPLLFDSRFIMWRALMFLPFAFAIGLLIRWRPRLFPHLLIGHFIIDMMSAVSVLMVSLNS